MDKRPIGVFDSGLGGLTVVKSIIEALPNENIVYFGDTGRVPYGNRSKETLIKYVKQDMELLVSRNVKAVVIACNTADSMARAEMTELYALPIIGVVEPAGKKAAAATKNKRVGVIATAATVASRAYESVISSAAPEVEVFARACPLLVPLVEEGRIKKGDIVTETVLREYLEPLKNEGIDTLILGCTHYPLLFDVISEILPGVELISSGFASTELLIDTLSENDLLSDGAEQGGIEFFVSDAPDKFAQNGGLFIGREISGRVEKVSFDKMSEAF